MINMVWFRVIVGAPKGTFPGGLGYADPGQSADDETGLVYVCPLLPGACEGLRGNMSLYSSDDDNDFDIAEGRLFDHYRKLDMNVLQVKYVVALFPCFIMQ